MWRAGVVTGDFMLRLPLDDFWPNFHLAPYFFAGFGGIIVGSVGNDNHKFVQRTVFVSRTQGAPANQAVTLTGRAAVGYRTTFLVAASARACRRRTRIPLYSPHWDFRRTWLCLPQFG